MLLLIDMMFPALDGDTLWGRGGGGWRRWFQGGSEIQPVMGREGVEDFEKLGVFYLGREYDLAKGEVQDDLLLYDSKDLVTHAVCVGMTGSGKTGLCIGLLEEAAIDGIPAIVIDPKGDLPNLLLTFPDLQTADFRPWVNEDDAARKNLTPDEFAQKQAELWTTGLADWGQDGARIRRLREAAEFSVYTPGSNAGLPISVLKSFSAPGPAILEDDELLRDRVSTASTSLLALLGIDADPIQSREHILLSTLFHRAWIEGRDLDLGSLIHQIQKPPLTKVGVLDIDNFYPPKERNELAMRLNNLLAAPGFQAWLEGDALDVGRLLHTAEGKPRVSIISIAHLSDTERMFFVSLLLNEILGWVRSQPGTSSLRALVYMDEIFGYFPPVATPPSKKPLLTLLKQARAYGVGVVLATQNPVDLDYKGLANTGTWFIGRLQTERDKARVLEGLEGAAAGAGGFDKGAMEQTLAGLGNRVFLMYNVHEDGPVTFHTRWAMSYLRGPLTRTQIKTLVDPVRAAHAAVSAATSTSTAQPAAADQPVSVPVAQPEGTATAAVPQPSPTTPPVTPAAVAAAGTAAAASAARPLLPPDVTELFVPVRGGSGDLVYKPALLGAAAVHFVDDKIEGTHDKPVSVFLPMRDAVGSMDWAAAEGLSIPVDDLEREPDPAASFAPLPSSAGQADSYKSWGKEFHTWLYRNQVLELRKSGDLKLVSRPGESEGDFRVRLQQAARERRDALTQELRDKYTAKLARIDESIRTAEQAVSREEEQAKGAKLQTVVSLGATLLGAFTGRKALSATTLGRATTAARGVGRSFDQAGDVGRAKETVEAKNKEKLALSATFEEEVAALESKMDRIHEELETFAVKPRKSDIDLKLVALVWMPYRRSTVGEFTPAWE